MVSLSTDDMAAEDGLADALVFPRNLNSLAEHRFHFRQAKRVDVADRALVERTDGVQCRGRLVQDFKAEIPGFDFRRGN